MEKLDTKKMIDVVEENIKKIKDKNFNIFFYVLDTQGNPSGSLEYIYQTAFILKNNGYNVTMLHNQKDFIGVAEWLGEKYNVLEHKNIETENVEINPCDFLFIPEIFTDVMSQTKKLPCKRIAIIQNYNYLSEFMPIAGDFNTMKISDAITTTNAQKEIINSYFPNLNVHVVPPSISKIFRESDAPKKLIINIVSRNQENVFRIMKPFYWKNPMYKWVSFRELRGLDQETLSNALMESPITVCVDENTNFGFVTLEALRCGSIVLSKVPNTLSDWNIEDDKLTDACLWFDNIDDVPDMLASLVYHWTTDTIPEEVYENIHKLDNMYTPETQEKEVLYTYETEIFSRRVNDFEEALAQIKKNKKEN